METKAHYENHLASYYTWMYGGPETKFAENDHFFRKHQLLPFSEEKLALDLGAGSGFQSIPLAKLGFTVVAIDFSRSLLDELKSYAEDLTITTLEQDILETDYSFYKPELVVCMVDTLLHVESIEAIQQLVNRIYECLLPKGKFVCSFRDLTALPEGEKRFIPVRSEKDILFTCFLENAGDKVVVYDIVHEWKSNQWIQKVNSYKKVKLHPSQMQVLLENAGFKLLHVETIRGLIHFTAEK